MSETRIIRAGNLDALKAKYELHRRDGFLWTELREVAGGGFEVTLVFSPTANEPLGETPERIRGIVEPGTEDEPEPAAEPNKPATRKRKR